MVAYIFTIQLQGELFGRFKNVIMWKVGIATFKEESRVAKESVGKIYHKKKDAAHVFSYRKTEKEKVTEAGKKEMITYAKAVHGL